MITGSYKKKQASANVTKSQSILFFATILRLFVSFALTIILGRYLMPAHYGFFTLINTLFIISRDLLDLGMGNIAARESIISPSKERNVIEYLCIMQGNIALLVLTGIMLYELLNPEAEDGAHPVEYTHFNGGVSGKVICV